MKAILNMAIAGLGATNDIVELDDDERTQNMVEQRFIEPVDDSTPVTGRELNPAEDFPTAEDFAGVEVVEGQAKPPTKSQGRSAKS